MPIRTGRIKSSVQNTSFNIINGKNGSSYRIFNSGEHEFEVDFGAGGGNSKDVLPDCSLDIVTKQTLISIITKDDPNKVPIKGIYEYVPSRAKDRDGRFKLPSSSQTTIIVTKSGDGDKLYRVFNSGENTFTVRNDSTDLPVEAEMSVDIAIRQNTSVEVISSSDAISGMYEVLDGVAPVRSGRFNRTVSPEVNHRIIDLQGGSSATGFYRILNSGSHPFMIWKGGQRFEIFPGSASPDKYYLLPEMSFDFEVTGGAKDIFVQSPNSTMPIEGIYDFLGN